MAWLGLPAMAWAQSYSLSTDPSADLLTVTFPKNTPPPVVARTGARRIEVLFPEGTKLGQASGVRGRHVERLSTAGNVLVVETARDAFGFVASPKGKNAVQIQVFFDPAGSRWKPPAGQPGQDAQAGQAAPPQSPPSPAGPASAPAPVAAEAPAPLPQQPPSSEVKGTIDFSGSATGSPVPAAPLPHSAFREASPTSGRGAPVSPGQSSQSFGQSPGQPPAMPQDASRAVGSPSGQAAQPGQSGQSGPAASPESVQPGPETVEHAPASKPGAGMGPEAGMGEVRGKIVPGGSPSSQAAVPGPVSDADKVSTPGPAASPAAGTATAPVAGQDAPQPSQASQPAAPVPGAADAQTAAPATSAPLDKAPDTAPAPAQESGEQGAGKEGLELTAQGISGEQALAREDYPRALSIANDLLQKPELPKDLHETALYMRAEALFALNRDKLAETYVETNDTLQQALNYNTTSTRLPRALIKLGLLNLKHGNLPEARAYFNLLVRKYPMDEEVPLIDVYWGEHWMAEARRGDAKANHQRAAESFKNVLTKYPESRFARDAALGLSRAQLELHLYAEADKIVDYIDKRWPRYYVESPVLRRVAADIAYKLGRFEQAKDDYLWFYNLVPNDPSNDLVLSRLGDVNVKLGKRDAAREFYDMAIRMYPGKEGALMSMMRLAEQGIHDAPTLQEMFKAFADPKDIRPDKIYEIITNEHPKSPLAPLALLKLSMWRLYKQEYPETLELVGRFVNVYPGDELEKQAMDVGAQAFGKMAGGLLEQNDYKRILELWRTYPYLATRQDVLSDTERLGVALSLYYQGAPKEALAMVEPFMDKGPGPATQKALALMLTIYRENQDWQAILDMLRKVSSWNLAPGPRRTLEFAQALALEHTGQKALSRLLWARLAADNELSPDKRAYAVYYQARTALERQDYDKALSWALDSRNLFKESAKDDGKARDALLLMIEANQGAGRYREALGMCAEYEAEAPPKSAEWAANRLRMAKLHRLLGDNDQWRKILVEMRDSMAGTLYGKLAASELTGRNIEERAGRLNGPP